MTSYPAPASRNTARAGDTTTSGASQPEHTEACHTCGIAVPESAQHTWPLPTSTGATVTAVSCGDCWRRPSGGPARLLAALAARHPNWVEGLPPAVFAQLPAQLAEPGPYAPHPSDLHAGDPGHPVAFAHVPEQQLVAAVDQASRQYWSPRPPVLAPERALTAEVVGTWPGPLACWRCGLAVDTNEGRVVEATSITDQWRAAQQHAHADRGATAEVQHDARLRADAPAAPPAAFRECDRCCGETGQDRARRLAVLASQQGHEPPEPDDPALTSMWTPSYAHSPLWDGPRDQGQDVAYAFASLAGWAAVARARAAHAAPEQPQVSPSGLPCQVCGTPTALDWDALAGLPCCRGCVDVFAPKPDRGAHTPETRAADLRPATHPRGEWWLTWELAPPPAADDFHAQQRWQASNLVCDADLICAHAAGRPGLVRAHLAAATGFYLAREHPHYRSRPDWSGPWTYLADLPRGSELGVSLAEAVRGVLNPPRPPAPEPAPQAAPAPTLARP